MDQPFKPGDLAVIRHSVNYPGLVGLQCKVLTPLDDFFVTGMGWVKALLVEIPEAASRGYPARAPGMGGWLVKPSQLRRPLSANDAGNWDQCCWRPDSLGAAQ